MILAIDPGNMHTALVLLDHNGQPHDHCYVENALAKKMIASSDATHMAIEMIACYGMAVGAEVFDTCVWIGRYIEAWDGSPYTKVYRKDVKLHLCGQTRAKDANVRQALIDRFGGKEKAIGKKASPGPLYGMSGDVWAALAVGITHYDQTKANP